MADLNIPQRETMAGHPTGLFTLFFAELWERFSYYGMRALLVFYMIKGFLGYGDGDAYTIYGAYTALVYMTPFFGGMIADRLIGARRAVILGGIFMAGGHLMMTMENRLAFFAALALLIVGNGFFKPNISTMVGSLYPEGSPKRDGGFTIFYIGINLGAAMAPLLCGYIGETFGWHKGFGLATVGMLTGLAVFVAPTIISQLLLLVSCTAATLHIIELPATESVAPYLMPIVAISMVLAGIMAFLSLGAREKAGNLEIDALSKGLTVLLILAGALGMAYAMVVFHPANAFVAALFYVVAAVLVVAAIVASAAVLKAGLPAGAGRPPSLEQLNDSPFGITNEWLVYLLALVSVPIFTLFVSGFEPIFGEKGGVQLISDSVIKSLTGSDSGLAQVAGTVIKEMSRPAGLVLMVAGVGALFYLLKNTFRLDTIQRQRMYVVLILTFFSMLFWSFFEQAGSSVNNFTDRNVNRVVDVTKIVSDGDVGQSVTLRIPLDTTDEKLQELEVLTQAFLGFENDDKAMQDQIVKSIRMVERAKIEEREKDGKYDPTVDEARSKLVAAVWEKHKGEVPEGDDEEEQKAFKEKVRASVEAAIEEASEISPKDDAEKKLFTDQLHDRVFVEKTIAAVLKEPRLTMTSLTYLREYAIGVDNPPVEEKTLVWKYAASNVGLRVGGSEIPASVYQSVNPIFILVLGLVFTMIWTGLNVIGYEPSTPVKFSLGLLQLGLGFACFWMGAQNAGEDGMSAMAWLVLGYLFQTTGELCLSPVGLSMVTKLSPRHLVSTVMGAWFLATAFSQFLAAIIAQFTGVSEGGEESVIPVPAETVSVYGGVFWIIAVSAAVSGVLCLIISPILKRWMHEDYVEKGEK